MTRNENPSDGAPQAEKPTRQRIAKLMARAGLCSRREAEAWIVDGRVSVNGMALTSPAVDVAPDDAILVDGAPLPQAEKTRLFLFHKPRGLVTSDHDPEGRATVAEFLRANWPEGPRVVTIGRLDINTEGLLLLTNDGGLARLLELPKTGWVRRYRVRAKGETDQGVLDRLREGVSIDGVDYAGIEATLDRVQGANVWLTMALREGKNREVKRVLESIGLEVNRLIRLSFGPFQLGDLPEGAVEEVRTRVLRDQLGPSLAASAGATFDEAGAPAETRPARAPRDAPAAPKTERLGREKRHEAPHRGRDERSGERPRRRQLEETPPQKRERPLAGTRKHVFTLRAAEAEATRHGPRRRIERSDVADRKDRAVRVERLVDARPGRPESRVRPRLRENLGEPRHRDARGETTHGDKRDARPDRRHASPSALAKRARVAKSGGDADMRRDGRSNAAPSYGRDQARRGRSELGKTNATGRPERGRTRETRRSGRRVDEREAATGVARGASREKDRKTGFGRMPSKRSGERSTRRDRDETILGQTPRPARGAGSRPAARDGAGAPKRRDGAGAPKRRDSARAPKRPGGAGAPKRPGGAGAPKRPGAGASRRPGAGAPKGPDGMRPRGPTPRPRR